MNIKTVTVIGANGTMGANVSAIFASFGNAKVYMVSRSIEKSRNAIAKAVKSVRAESIASNLIPADYSMLEECIKQSDLVFESAAENLSIKTDITNTVAAVLREDAIACTGTSGLSITKLAECFPDHLRSRYYGVHMFNPPYNMTLCELISTKYSDAEITKKLRNYLETVLYRAVVETKDEPAFLGNRIGFQFINEAMQYADQYKDKGGIDYIDAILGTFTGRAMAPLTTADFVGLDVHKAIVDNVYQNTNDYAHDTFILPSFVQKLIDEGKLGRKAGIGFYKLEKLADGKKQMTVYDIASDSFRNVNVYRFSFAEEMKRYIKEGDYSSAFKVLISDQSVEADICLNFLLRYIVYSLFISKSIGFDIQAADTAMATGFNWCPPLAMVQAFSLVCDIKALMIEKLPAEIIHNVDMDEFVHNIRESKFDFRAYFKSSK